MMNMPCVARLCVVFCLMLATGTERADAAPHLEVVGGLRQELGSIGLGEHKGSIYITNTGDTALEIRGLKPACGCMTATIERTYLEPGDTGLIRWSLWNSRGPGEYITTITVESNDSSTKFSILSIAWTTVVDLGSERGGDPITLKYDTLGNVWRGELALRNLGTDTILVSPPVAVMSYGVEMKQLLPASSVRLNPGQTMMLSVAAARSSRKSSRSDGVSLGALELKTTGHYTPSLTVPLYALP